VISLDRPHAINHRVSFHGATPAFGMMLAIPAGREISSSAACRFSASLILSPISVRVLDHLLCDLPFADHPIHLSVQEQIREPLSLGSHCLQFSVQALRLGDDAFGVFHLWLFHL
jgi:hypothetical protein